MVCLLLLLLFLQKLVQDMEVREYPLDTLDIANLDRRLEAYTDMV
jgi:hypothetical protein